MTTIESPVALISGASRGIGLATAEAFAIAGYRLAIVGTNSTTLQDSVSRLPEETLTIAGDLSDMEFTDTIVPQTVERFGRVDVLINNAAWREIISLRSVSLDSWERTLRVCLTAPAFLAKAAAADMELRGNGVILNVGSIMSQQAAGISPAYVACKGAIEALTFELASLYGPSGIRVITLQPGAIDTDLCRELSEGEDHDGIRSFSEDMIMLERWGRCHEIANVLVFLASAGASYITGTTLAVDGGWLRQHFPMSVKRRAFPGDFS